jgi:hypothetical protein
MIWMARLLRRPGLLHAVAAQLHEMTKSTKELNEIIRSASLEPV